MFINLGHRFILFITLVATAALFIKSSLFIVNVYTIVTLSHTNAPVEVSVWLVGIPLLSGFVDVCD